MTGQEAIRATQMLLRQYADRLGNSGQGALDVVAHTLYGLTNDIQAIANEVEETWKSQLRAQWPEPGKKTLAPEPAEC